MRSKWLDRILEATQPRVRKLSKRWWKNSFLIMAFPFFCPLDFNNEVTKKNTYSILASFSATLHQLLSNLNVHVMFCDDVITAVGFELSFDGEFSERWWFEEWAWLVCVGVGVTQHGCYGKQVGPSTVGSFLWYFFCSFCCKLHLGFVWIWSHSFWERQV